MPTLALEFTSWPRTRKGSENASATRRASSAASSGRLMPVRSTANSSPCSRASTSPSSSRSRRRRATAWSRPSPNSWPKASLTPLKRSRSTCSSAEILCSRRALQLLLGAVLERGGVRQAGQAVEAGRARAVGLLLPQLGDVERDAQHLGRPARRVGERGLGGQEAALAAAQLDRLRAPARERHAGLAHLLVAHAAAQRVVLAVRLGQRAA